jgi:hypothetical protein
LVAGGVLFWKCVQNIFLSQRPNFFHVKVIAVGVLLWFEGFTFHTGVRSGWVLDAGGTVACRWPHGQIELVYVVRNVGDNVA